MHPEVHHISISNALYNLRIVNTQIYEVLCQLGRCFIIKLLNWFVIMMDIEENVINGGAEGML